VRFSEHAQTYLDRQITRDADVDAHTQEFFEFDLEPTEVEERRLRERIHEQIEIAAFMVAREGCGTEHARIGSAITANDCADGVAVLSKGV
jgi:hypothetical protein